MAYSEPQYKKSIRIKRDLNSVGKELEIFYFKICKDLSQNKYSKTKLTTYIYKLLDNILID